MQIPQIRSRELPGASWEYSSRLERKNKINFGAVIFLLVISFSWWLYRLVAFSSTSSLYSHIPLIPAIVGYLVWINRKDLSCRPHPDQKWVWLPISGISVSLLLHWQIDQQNSGETSENALVIPILAFVIMIWASAIWFLSRSSWSKLGFPFLFLIFIVPLPIFILDAIETGLQHGSAATAYALFSISTTPVYHENLSFQLPGITINVAPECSGIHSTLVLLITSLLMGHFFLRSTLRKFLLTFLIVPLALIRNGFRIFVIGELCARIGPEMINSYIHRQGGPIFFVLSLVPLFLVLVYLIRSERKFKVPISE